MVKYSKLKFDSSQEMESFVKLEELNFENQFSALAKRLSLIPDLKIITLSGPSCSGKTTAANKLVSEFSKYSKRINIISIDDFYYDKHKLHEISRLKGMDRVDYDSADTIDISALHDFSEEIFDKGSPQVHCPVFDFKKGVRVGYRTIECTEDDIFVFEGIQALYPQVTAMLDEREYESVYICAQSALDVGGIVFEPNEIRFLRRLVRDHNFRATSAEQTFELWHNVRHNEDINIFPFADNCTYRIDSTFGFDVALLKPYLENILSEIKNDSAYYREAKDILDKIAPIEAIPKKYISENSLYREFI